MHEDADRFAILRLAVHEDVKMHRMSAVEPEYMPDLIDLLIFQRVALEWCKSVRGVIWANNFGTDILIQAERPKKAALFYAEHLGFAITDEKPNLISLHGKHINLFIERGVALGPVLEVTAKNIEEARDRLVRNGCEIIKDEPDFPRCYVKDPFGLIYNLTM